MTLQKYSVLKEHAFEFSCDFSCIKKKGFGALSKKIKEARKAFIFPCLFVPGVISSHN